MKKSNHSPRLRFLNDSSIEEGFGPLFLAVPFMISISLIAFLPWVAS